MTRGRRGVWAALCVAVATVAVAAAADIKVTPVVTPEGKIVASIAASQVYTSDLRTLVQTGLLTTFTYTLELKRPATLWFDSTLATATVVATVKFDNLTGVYDVSKQQDGHVIFAQRTSEEDTMKSWVTQFDRVPVDASSALEVNAEYYVQARLHVTPRHASSWWPWGHTDGTGRSADFAYIR